MVAINSISNRSSILQKGGKGSLFDFELIDYRCTAHVMELNVVWNL